MWSTWGRVEGGPGRFSLPLRPLIQRSRFARHVRDCTIQPCPIAAIKGSFKEVVALVREGADRRVTCFCDKVVKASEKDVSVAKALALHFTSHHRGMTAGERIENGATFSQTIMFWSRRTRRSPSERAFLSTRPHTTQ